MQMKVPLTELDNRLERFRLLMDDRHPDWEIVIIFSKLNLYYFTGTMQDGMLLIPRNGEACLWVRRSYERAVDESCFLHIRQMRSTGMLPGRCRQFPGPCTWKLSRYPLRSIRDFRNIFLSGM